MYNQPQLSPQQTIHPVAPAILLPVIYMLERFSYYGVRGILILYMMQKLQMDRELTMDIYSMFTMAMYLFIVPGGIFGDFVLKPVPALIIGVAAEALGCFLLTVPATPVFAGGLLLIVIGSSLFKPVMTSLLGTHYMNTGRGHLLDSGYSILYAGINIGAFCAPLVIGTIAENGSPWRYALGFIIAGVAALLALGVLLVSGSRLHAPPVQPVAGTMPYQHNLHSGNSNKVLNVIAVIVLLPVFWQAYSLISLHYYSQTEHAFTDTAINGIVILLTGVVSFVAWTFVRLDSRIKIASGLLLMVLLLLLSMAASHNPGIPLLTILLASFAEMLVAIPASSVIIYHAPPQWRATFFALGYFLTGTVNWVAQKLIYSSGQSHEQAFGYLVMIGCLLIGVSVLVLALVSRRQPHSS